MSRFWATAHRVVSVPGRAKFNKAKKQEKAPMKSRGDRAAANAHQSGNEAGKNVFGLVALVGKFCDVCDNPA